MKTNILSIPNINKARKRLEKQVFIALILDKKQEIKF
jgi:hypothetical protein